MAHILKNNQSTEARIEELGAGKNPFCRHYDQCLTRAARRDVTFCCQGCAHERDYWDYEYEYEYDDFLPIVRLLIAVFRHDDPELLQRFEALINERHTKEGPFSLDSL
ncbi:hypothetical protein HNR65_002247 [Desulfosalsimonas propionicica]|uniref:Uncharacterized protein n=1 Tax=Desulfosalsimonas propionicica TaxID=332175 RepID=A0A7W0HL58_9BACT|nr:hypothetical protein [Desulfosalsimonas propionicica]MBA2881913.1 hypothetical protein [Desulfosalsimonas propionicica]